VRRTTLFVLIALVCVVVAGCGGGGSSNSSGPPAALLHPAKLKAKAPQLFTATFKTTKGTFEIEAHRTWAPIAADRFYNLVKAHFFDGEKFFRVVPGFVVQFGISPYPAVSTAWRTATIPDDIVTGIHNNLGGVTFASAGPDTRTTQIFINLGNNTTLDANFPPFGVVASGLDVVEKLYAGYRDTPTSQQGDMESQGSVWLDSHYPKLDSIETARVTAESNPALP
jgi:cyclophilin family peptidyl-prolyl cis-trans isomerase